MTDRIANRDAKGYVAKRKPFNGSHLYAVEKTTATGTQLYVVYSYGEHYPMYIAETAGTMTAWYVNDEPSSQSTGRHRSQANPGTACLPLSCTDMQRVARNGFVCHLLDTLNGVPA
jgi:hypothetical protein